MTLFSRNSYTHLLFSRARTTSLCRSIHVELNLQVDHAPSCSSTWRSSWFWWRFCWWCWEARGFLSGDDSNKSWRCGSRRRRRRRKQVREAAKIDARESKEKQCPALQFDSRSCRGNNLSCVLLWAVPFWMILHVPCWMIPHANAAGDFLPVAGRFASEWRHHLECR